MDTSAVELIKSLMPFHHNYVLPDGTNTRVSSPTNYPQVMMDSLSRMFPSSMDGLHVLDIGCNSGGVSRILANRGAVCEGIDIRQDYLDQAAAVNALFPTTATFSCVDFLDIEDKTYDVVLFLGVIYHMRRYKEAFPKIKSLLKPGGWGVVETASGPKTHIYMGTPGDTYVGDDTNHWVPDKNDLVALIEDSGLVVVDTLEWVPVTSMNPYGRLAAKFRL